MRPSATPTASPRSIGDIMATEPSVVMGLHTTHARLFAAQRSNSQQHRADVLDFVQTHSLKYRHLKREDHWTVWHVTAVHATYVMLYGEKALTQFKALVSDSLLANYFATAKTRCYEQCDMLQTFYSVASNRKYKYWSWRRSIELHDRPTCIENLKIELMNDLCTLIYTHGTDTALLHMYCYIRSKERLNHQCAYERAIKALNRK